MKVFLSWAGKDSQYIATTLKDWLPQVLQAVEPWMSTEIEKGEAWDGAIAEGLNASPVGILCLTKDSIKSNYLHYEAGAIANVKNSKVCTFLYKIKNADVKQPLGRFQHTRFEKDEVLKLLITINQKLTECGERSLPETQLQKALELNWNELVEKLKHTPESNNESIERPERDILEEVLQLVRNLGTQNQQIEPTVIYEDSQRHGVFVKRQFSERSRNNLMQFIIDYLFANNIALDDAHSYKNDIIKEFRKVEPGIGPSLYQLDLTIDLIKKHGHTKG